VENGLTTYKVWAPADALWSPWVKPALFIYTRAAVPVELKQITWTGPAQNDTLIIVDLPGEYGLLEALSLIPLGYRPIPLYNCVDTIPSSAYMPLISVNGIAEMLFSGAALITEKRFAPDAPPAFVLDSRRMELENTGDRYGKYDNRWCIFPQDMPSADFLRDHNIKKVVVRAESVQNDMSHILERWQNSGLEVYLCTGADTAPQAIMVKKPPLFKSLSYRFKTMSGLRKNTAGGFGGYVPEPSESSGHYG